MHTQFTDFFIVKVTLKTATKDDLWLRTLLLCILSLFYLGGNGGMSSVILATRDAASCRIHRIGREKKMSLSLFLSRGGPDR